MRLAAVVAAAALAVVACDDGPGPVLPLLDARPRTWLRPPSGEVRAYPPHAIRSDGVGPFFLDAPMAEVLRNVPEGPRVEIFQLGSDQSWRVVRAEAGQLLIGASATTRVDFIAVLAPDVARTAAGVGVGATVAELEKALGPARGHSRDSARDRLIFEAASLPGVIFVSDSPPATEPAAARVIAALVRRADLAPAPALHSCRILAPGFAELRRPGVAVRAGCFSGAAPEALVEAAGEVSVLGGDPVHPRRLAAAPVAPGACVDAIDIDGDGRDEVFISVKVRSPALFAVDVRILRLDGGRLIDVVNARAFSLDAAAAAAAGVRLENVDIVLEVRGGPTGPSASGLFVAGLQSELRQLAPLGPVALRFDARRPPGQDAAPATLPADGGSR